MFSLLLFFSACMHCFSCSIIAILEVTFTKYPRLDQNHHLLRRVLKLLEEQLVQLFLLAKLLEVQVLQMPLLLLFSSACMHCFSCSIIAILEVTFLKYLRLDQNRHLLLLVGKLLEQILLEVLVQLIFVAVLELIFVVVLKLIFLDLKNFEEENQPFYQILLS